MGGNNVPAGEGFPPVGLLGKGEEEANLVGSSLAGKREEWPPLLRGNAESSCTLDLGALLSAFPHLKQTTTERPGDEAGHPRRNGRRAGAAARFLRGAWLEGVALFAWAPVPRRPKRILPLPE